MCGVCCTPWSMSSCSLASMVKIDSSRRSGMTPASNAATDSKLPKLIVVSLLGIVAVSYLGAYFFLLFLKLTSTEASPLTLPRYAYYYWDNTQVRSRLIGAGASHPERRSHVGSGHHSGTL